MSSDTWPSFALDLHGRAELYLSEDMVDSLCFYDYIVRLEEEDFVSNYNGSEINTEVQLLQCKNM